ncbi:Hypothetical_protein [Hexamita inflata]|uniref:Hypothetical_protein n=1 Tax=Hexamita inflata TaxID=28002 RepID=A0AA86PTG2_9EUKA|nr:Hypothetical protein HINF_LOCUS32126 [Hexamita inflata]
MNSLVMNSERLSKKVVYQTRFVSDKDVKRQKVVQQMDNAELQGTLFFGTEYYCNARLPDYKINNAPNPTQSFVFAPKEHSTTKLIKINQCTQKSSKPPLIPRPPSPHRIFQEIKSQSKDSREFKKSNLKFSPTEKMLLENLNQFDISISESDETEEKRGLVKNESGKLIQVAIPTYQRSEKTRRMLQVQMDELNSIQTQINKQIHQLQ